MKIKIKLLSFLLSSLILMSFWNMNPVNLTISFLLVSILVSMMSLMIMSKWIFYVLVLFYVGGMMVMFVYIVSLLNTEKFLTLDAGGLQHVLPFLLLFYLLDDSTWAGPKSFLSNIFKSFELMSTPFLALVLLMVLIAVVKLCDSWKGSLKSKVNE